MRLEIIAKEDGIFEISGEIDEEEINQLIEFEKTIPEDVFRGLMKTYCCRCHDTGECHEYKSWSFAAAIGRCAITCTGAFGVSKGGC